MDKLGQLGVGATAVVNLKSCVCIQGYFRLMCDTHLYICNVSLAHLSDMFFNQVVVCVVLSTTKSEHESKHTMLSLSVTMIEHLMSLVTNQQPPSPALGLRLIIALIFCDDKVLVLLVSLCLRLFLFTELQQFECLIFFTTLQTHSQTFMY